MAAKARPRSQRSGPLSLLLAPRTATFACLLMAFTWTLFNMALQPLSVEQSSKMSLLPFWGGGHLNYVVPFPVYYINMEQSSARRERMQLDFGDIWDLRRSPAVDGMNAGAVVELMGQANYDEILPSISKDRYPGTINGGELGCVLSHLTAIRRAYIEGNDMAMIVEDDITPLLMPFWTGSLMDVVNEAVNYSNGTWEVVQTAWIWGMDENIYDRSVHPFGPGRQVLRKRFQFGTSAYIVSKRGMEKILDAYFTDRTETGQIRLRKGGDQAELYIYGAVSNLYIAVPSFFTIEGSDTTISIGEESRRRLSSHQASNNIHIKTTFDLYHEMKKTRSP